MGKEVVLRANGPILSPLQHRFRALTQVFGTGKRVRGSIREGNVIHNALIEPFRLGHRSSA
jgi:hypothetical protein